MVEEALSRIEVNLTGFDLGKPVIAAVNGHALAGGMELMLACDLRVVAKGVKLGRSEVALGLVPGMGGTALLQRHVPNALAMNCALCAQPIPGGRHRPVRLVQSASGP